MNSQSRHLWRVAGFFGEDVLSANSGNAVTRRLPGVLGKDESVEERRVASHDPYTRPDTIEWEGKKHKVPPVLKTGSHANIDAFRAKKAGKK